MTSINASHGVVTSGNLTLAFHLVPDEEGEVLQAEGTDSSRIPRPLPRSRLLGVMCEGRV